jgi:hypothetical protein
LNEASDPIPWHHQIIAVIPRHVLLKSIGTTLFIGLFFGAYLYLLKTPVYPTTVMPVTLLDHLIGFQPQALPLYISLWVYVSLPPALLSTRRELYGYALAMAATCLAGLVIFYFWPTAVPAAHIDWSQDPAVDFLKNMDASGNACPSLHVATAVFSAAWLHHPPACGSGCIGRPVAGAAGRLAVIAFTQTRLDPGSSYSLIVHRLLPTSWKNACPQMTQIKQD